MNIYLPAVYVAIMLLGATFTNCKLLPKDAHKALFKVLVNVTLPAAVVCAFERFNGDKTLFLLIPLGLCCSAIPFLAAFCFSGRRKREERVFCMMNAGGYNIGCFALVVVSGVYGGVAPVVASLFDAGNALVVTGGSYAVAEGVLPPRAQLAGGKKPNFFKRLFSSVPFDVYLVMTVFALCSVTPAGITIALLQPIANANGFLAMFTAGCMIRVSGAGKHIKSVLLLEGIRLAFSLSLALGFYFLLPFGQIVRNTLVLVAFAPISVLASHFTELLGGDGEKSALCTSVSSVVSILMMLVLAAVLPV